MAGALALARRGRGRVWPNPTVGAVLVKDGRVVGRGWTQPGGRPHAETEALRRAGPAARGATIYVTLEPCAHHGKTPPCADALVEAGIARAVVALEDPDPRVSGRGMARLQQAGIPVDVGLGEAEAKEINLGFLTRLAIGRPMVTLKIATTLDGRIATHSGESRWISGEPARALAHALRANHDAVLVGVGTALIDDPLLTCRLPGLAQDSPVRIVVDGHLRLPLTSALAASATTTPTWIACLENADRHRKEAFRDCGVDIIQAAANDGGRVDLAALLRELGDRGITRLLVEGGSQIVASLLRLDLVDRVVWCRSARFIGGDGVPVAAPLGLRHLADAPAFTLTDVARIGEDVMETYARAG
ncbi:MAG: bifunctional diaminohydroxyphosphoribosylaminopyrimidine deaminase/5-amino-6-(5-phosphoribosylamino)uracil reductase RibD [Proteobacteria bacterium]|nr:bifunctional diaminohydroxyphosphoribosylaminopyrimidine deaminase/5-amino-6-(5-phosphoribosylamino)uracil reductase RibD [Pseudomonadota bacterium]MBI3496022.1 bifunctional diaminohydroxyphosphoribosylaminopyrimidine deaminase/5-amino-6-(5-phosphoribosylamino)uracil reductase RibD [Pseudomonadota bacterium]